MPATRMTSSSHCSRALCACRVRHIRRRPAAVLVSANSAGMSRDALCRNSLPRRTASPMEPLSKSKAQIIPEFMIFGCLAIKNGNHDFGKPLLFCFQPVVGHQLSNFLNLLPAKAFCYMSERLCDMTQWFCHVIKPFCQVAKTFCDMSEGLCHMAKLFIHMSTRFRHITKLL